MQTQQWQHPNYPQSEGGKRAGAAGRSILITGAILVVVLLGFWLCSSYFKGLNKQLDDAEKNSPSESKQPSTNSPFNTPEEQQRAQEALRQYKASQGQHPQGQ